MIWHFLETVYFLICCLYRPLFLMSTKENRLFTTIRKNTEPSLVYFFFLVCFCGQNVLSKPCMCFEHLPQPVPSQPFFSQTPFLFPLWASKTPGSIRSWWVRPPSRARQGLYFCLSPVKTFPPIGLWDSWLPSYQSWRASWGSFRWDINKVIEIS